MTADGTIQTLEIHGELRVVRAQPPDLERYLRLLEEVAAWLRASGLNHWNTGDYQGFTHYFGASIGRGEVHLAILGGDLVGTLRLLEQDDIVWPEIRTSDGLYVYNLAIDRAWSGRGLGLRLLEFASDRVRSMGKEYLRLDCLADNAFLQHYYENAGFCERGEVSVNYAAPVGELRLRRFERRIAPTDQMQSP